MATARAEPARDAPARAAAPGDPQRTPSAPVQLPAQIGNAAFVDLLRAEPTTAAPPPVEASGTGAPDAATRVRERAADRVSRSTSARAFAVGARISFAPGAAAAVRRWPWSTKKKQPEISGPTNARKMTFAERGGVFSNAQLIKQQERRDRRSGDESSGDDSGLGSLFGGPEAESTTAQEGGVAPAKERGKTPQHPAPHRPGFDLAGGQEILTKAFGDIKKVVPGSIEVLDQAAFEKAYDKIYGAGDYSWAKYVKPKYGSLNGFAYQGTNYINKASAGLHTIVHEMLHNNAAADWVGVVGSRWNEGTTEVLTKKACKLFNEPAPTCYPGESPVVEVALRHGLPEKDLEDAYFTGGAQEKVADWVDKHCVLSWAEVKAKLEANEWAAAKAGLAKKPAQSSKPKATTP